jgi:uncharacterized protein
MNKIKTVFLLLILSTFINNVSAQLLWKVEGNGLQQASYLYGTMHVLCPEDFNISEQVLKAFQNTEELVLEIDATDPVVLAEMQQFSINPGFENIYTGLPKEDYKRIDRALANKFGAGLDQMGIMKPFVLSSMIMTTLLPCAQLESPEIYFAGLAKEKDKKIQALETASLQIGIFDKIPTDLQIREIIKMLKEGGADEFHHMKGAYVAGNLLALEQAMSDNEMMRDWKNLILIDRNKQWVQTLGPSMLEKSLFIAVGAGHLPGEEGLIELLRNEGFQVTPIW